MKPTHFGELTLPQSQQILSLLAPFVSPERQQRIDQVLAQRTRDVVLVLEDVVHEHNAAAVLRTSDAMGLLEVHNTQITGAFRLSKHVSRGAHKWFDIRSWDRIEPLYADLRARGYRIYASDVHGDSVPPELLPSDGKLALVFGNEHQGLSEAAQQHLDGRFHIPMVGFTESLNVSVAAAIVLHSVMRLRRPTTPLAPDEIERLRATWWALSVKAAPSILAQAGLPLPSMAAPLRLYDRRLKIDEYDAYGHD